MNLPSIETIMNLQELDGSLLGELDFHADIGRIFDSDEEGMHDVDLVPGLDLETIPTSISTTVESQFSPTR